MIRYGEAYGSGAPPVRDRVYAGAGAAATVGLLGYALLLGLDVHVGQVRDRALAVLDLRTPPPPPPKREVPPPEHPKPRARQAPAPPNLRNKATPVVVPPPIVHLPPPPPPVVVAPVAGAGMAANTGASDRPGPGTGAGGKGHGPGGGGDDDGDNSPPEFIKGDLKFSDLPPDLREAGAQGSVDVRYRVEVSGRVSDCQPSVKSGPAALGPATCDAIVRRFRYRPSLDPDGRPVTSYIYENQTWVVDRTAMRDAR